MNILKIITWYTLDGWIIWYINSIFIKLFYKRLRGPELLWLWHRPVAIALIRPLDWEPPYVVGTVLEKAKRHTHTHTHTKPEGSWSEQAHPCLTPSSSTQPCLGSLAFLPPPSLPHPHSCCPQLNPKEEILVSNLINSLGSENVTSPLRRFQKSTNENPFHRGGQRQVRVSPRSYYPASPGKTVLSYPGRSPRFSCLCSWTFTCFPPAVSMASAAPR